MTEVTLNPKAAAEALDISTWDLAHQLRKAAVGRLTAIADQIKDPHRDRESKLGYLDEMMVEVRRLLAAAEACDDDWWGDLAA